MKAQNYNYLGQTVEANDLRLSNPAFGEVGPDGSVIRVHWAEADEDVDENGFDKSYAGTDGYYDVITLPIGTRLGRFGSSRGFLTAPAGTPYDMLSLPYKQETCEYHEYVVISNNCKVMRGLVAPMFGKPGGGVQYYHENGIAKEIYDKNIEEETKWLEEQNRKTEEEF